jgi:serine/threonine protein kinase/tetratricopeptide (TPR) repeat protein
VQVTVINGTTNDTTLIVPPVGTATVPAKHTPTAIDWPSELHRSLTEPIEIPDSPLPYRSVTESIEIPDADSPLPDGGRDSSRRSVGRYQILDVLGRGGMGVVYKAFDPELDRPVALKLVVFGAGAEESRMRLLREAKTLAQLSHPNVIAVHDVGSHDGDVYVAMEFVVGVTLRTWLEKPRTPREILAVFRAAGAGLAAAHRLGIVHRDFKPDNVMVGDDGRVRVLDFGLARSRQHDTRSVSPAPIPAHEVRITRPGAVMGTPRYMAPEQDLGKPADGRSDQFSFCTALFEALFAAAPFPGTTYAEISKHRLSGELEVPSNAWHVSPRVRRALRRGLKVDPQNRHPSMDALLLALREPRRWRQLAITALAATTVAVGGLAAWLATHQAPSVNDLCGASSATEIEQVWSPKRRAELIESFGANAPPMATQLILSLDDYVTQWKRRRLSECKLMVNGGSARNHESEMQLQCLRERATELDTRVSVLLVAAREPLVERSRLYAARLTPLESCDSNGSPRLSDELRDRVVEDVIAGTAALGSGDLDEAERRAKGAIWVSTADGNEPDAAALLLLGRVQSHRSASTTTDAKETLLQSVRSATQADDKGLVAEAWIALIELAFVDRKMLNHVEDKLFSADLAGLRLDSDDDRRASLALGIARLEVLRGELDDAFAKLKPILAYYQRDPEKYNVELATTETTIGLGLTLRGEFKEAQVSCEYALTRFERMPVAHVNMAAAIFCLADIASLHRDFATAQSLEARRVRLLEQLGDAARPQLALAHFGFAYALARGGQCVRAAPLLAQSRTEISTVFGDDSPFVGFALLGEGHCALAAGNRREAIALLERASVLAHEPPALLHLPHVNFTLARALVTQDKRRAIDLAEQARTEFSKYPGTGAYREDVESWLAAQRPKHGQR